MSRPSGTRQLYMVGIEPGDVDKAQRSLAQHIGAKFCPVIRFEIEAVECEGKRVLVVRGEREPHVPLGECDGRAFIREGSETRQRSLPEKLQIIRHRDRDQHRGPWRCDKCGSTAVEFFGGSSTARPSSEATSVSAAGSTGLPPNNGFERTRWARRSSRLSFWGCYTQA